jgi:hypothetical protein
MQTLQDVSVDLDELGALRLRLMAWLVQIRAYREQGQTGQMPNVSVDDLTMGQLGRQFSPALEGVVEHSP